MQNGLLRGWAQRLIRKVFTEGTCKGCFLRLVLDVSFQLQLLLRWWTYKKNAGLRKLCICFTFQTQKHHPSHILSSCKQSSFYKKVLKFESLHNPNIIWFILQFKNRRALLAVLAGTAHTVQQSFYVIAGIIVGHDGGQKQSPWVIVFGGSYICV